MSNKEEDNVNTPASSSLSTPAAATTSTTFPAAAPVAEGSKKNRPARSRKASSMVFGPNWSNK